MKIKYFLIILWIFVLGIIHAQNSVTVYTPANNAVEGYPLQEFSLTEITTINNQYISAYPSATLIGNASQTYNCHSYAWNISAGGTTICWINQKTRSGEANISKYWSENTYMSTTEANAYKIFYYNGDHSATRSSVAGYYESKWGAAPLMRHAPTYGPASCNMTSRQYYIPRTSSISGATNLSWSGDYISELYSADLVYKSKMGAYKWSTNNAKNAQILANDGNGSNAGAIFYAAGIYQIYCSFITSTGQTYNQASLKVTILNNGYRILYDSSAKTLELVRTAGETDLKGKSTAPYQVINLLSGAVVNNGGMNLNGDRVSLSSLPKGVYVVHLKIDELNQLTEKIVIQ